MRLTQDEFLKLHLLDGESYAIIAEKYDVPRPQLSEWWERGIELREQIAKANQLFNSRKGKAEFTDFESLGKRKFFEWFQQQERKCTYCGIEEKKLIQLFESGKLSTKRNRGKSLELERRDAKSNQYSIDNCVFICYFCNNHKSDIISEEDHKKYFAPSIKQYLEDQYKEIKR